MLAGCRRKNKCSRYVHKHLLPAVLFAFSHASPKSTLQTLHGFQHPASATQGDGETDGTHALGQPSDFRGARCVMSSGQVERLIFPVG